MGVEDYGRGFLDVGRKRREDMHGGGAEKDEDGITR